MDEEGEGPGRALHRVSYDFNLVLELLIVADLVRVEVLQQLLLKEGLRQGVQWGLLGMMDEMLG